MKTLFARCTVTVSIILLLICALSCTETPPRDATPKSSDSEAADFTLKSLSGETFKMKNQRGRHVLLIFVTSWCAECRSQIPHYKKIHETYSKKGLEVVMIDVLESKNVVSRFAARYDF